MVVEDMVVEVEADMVVAVEEGMDMAVETEMATADNMEYQMGKFVNRSRHWLRLLL
ncbi:hypothetical protein GQL56_28055 [Pseudomonas putida]|nr:hypothetical protein [Pseudomonas putida]